MWQLTSSAAPPLVRWETLRGDTAPMSYAEVAHAWRDSPPFRDFWVDAVRALPFAACCFETPPLTRGSGAQPFECVFVDSPALARAVADPAAFAPYLAADGTKGVVCFENLGRDATLIAPVPSGAGVDCAHLAAFHRTAPRQLACALWECIGTQLVGRIGAAPLWLSTAGLGVPWLHLRLDSRPKYYRHRPYASAGYDHAAR